MLLDHASYSTLMPLSFKLYLLYITNLSFPSLNYDNPATIGAYFLCFYKAPPEPQIIQLFAPHDMK